MPAEGERRTMPEIVIGVIGGSGFYTITGLEGLEQIELETPFGPPSDTFYRGRLGDVQVVFLARHGRGHRLLPTEINFRANIYGMKQLGVEHLVSVSSAGSMREDLHPGDFLVPDQFIDRTNKRAQSFFGNGIVGHVSLADPVCPVLSAALTRAGHEAGARIRSGGVYLCIEGPQFSTRAESNLYRSWNVDVISMTAMQEVRLAREAELCYAVMALVTDYDCWHQDEREVDIGSVLRVLNQNVAVAQRAVARLAPILADTPRTCTCAHALKDAIITHRTMIPRKVAADLHLLVGKYL
jgi:5'-methylthioadenosine phosphorylase